MNQLPHLSIESIQTEIESNPSIINSKDKETGLTLLAIAIEQEDYHLSEYLINKGADVNVKNSNGQSLLHIAVEKSNNRLINLLLEKDINPNSKDKLGNTPMHLAALKGDYKVIKLLLLYLANPFMKNQLGYYPIDYARDTNHMKSYNVLLNYHSRSSKNLSSITHTISPIGTKSILYSNKNKDSTEKIRSYFQFKSESKFKVIKPHQHQSCASLFNRCNIREVNDKIEPSIINNNVRTNNSKVILEQNNENNDEDDNCLETEECTPSSKDVNLVFQWNHSPLTMTKELFNDNGIQQNNSNYNKEDCVNVKGSNVYESKLIETFTNGKEYHCYCSINNNIDCQSKEINIKDKENSNNHKHSFKRVHYQYQIINEEINQDAYSSIYYLLKEIHLEKYTDLFNSEGFEDIDNLISFIKNPIEFKAFIANKLNNILPGNKAKLLIKLQEISHGFDIKIPQALVYYYLDKSFEESTNDPQVISLNNWLTKLNMQQYLIHFFNAGYYSIELLLIQMYSNYPLTEQDISNYLQVHLLGHRTRLMNQLKEDSLLFINQLKENNTDYIKLSQNDIKAKDNKSKINFDCNCMIY